MTGPGSLGRIRAVTFDVGGTLLTPWPSVGEVYSEGIRQLGLPTLDPGLIEARFQSAWSSQSSFDYSRSAWATLVRRVLTDLVPVDSMSRVFDRLWIRFAEADAWHVFPDVAPCLAGLARSGIRMAVVSNWDERLHPLLEAVNLAGAFEFILPSVEGPAPKPDVRLFQLAAARLGIPSETILHVGDGWREDVEGARSAGFEARWLCRDRPRSEDLRPDTLRSLSELPSHLVDA